MEAERQHQMIELEIKSCESMIDFLSVNHRDNVKKINEEDAEEDFKKKVIDKLEANYLQSVAEQETKIKVLKARLSELKD